LNCDPPDLCLLSSWDYSHEPQVPRQSLSFYNCAFVLFLTPDTASFLSRIITPDCIYPLWLLTLPTSGPASSLSAEAVNTPVHGAGDNRHHLLSEVSTKGTHPRASSCVYFQLWECFCGHLHSASAGLCTSCHHLCVLHYQMFSFHIWLQQLCLFFSCSTGAWTQGLTLARHVLLTPIYFGRLFWDGFFWDWVLWTICPGLTLNCYPPELCLLSG
jgi:hypothetical protein